MQRSVRTYSYVDMALIFTQSLDLDAGYCVGGRAAMAEQVSTLI